MNWRSVQTVRGPVLESDEVDQVHRAHGRTVYRRTKFRIVPDEAGHGVWSFQERTWVDHGARYSSEQAAVMGWIADADSGKFGRLEAIVKKNGSKAGKTGAHKNPREPYQVVLPGAPYAESLHETEAAALREAQRLARRLGTNVEVTRWGRLVATARPGGAQRASRASARANPGSSLRGALFVNPSAAVHKARAAHQESLFVRTGSDYHRGARDAHRGVPAANPARGVSTKKAIPHVSGWKTFDHVVRVGRRDVEHTFFAPTTKAAHEYAARWLAELHAATGKSGRTVSLHAR